MRAASTDRLAVENDRLARNRQSAGDRAQKRRLPRSIGADDGNRFAFTDRDVNTEQRLKVAIEGREILCLQQTHDIGMPI